jgi:hypothetical protein
MPRPRKKNADELRVTLDPALARPVKACMDRFGFSNETEFVRHMVRIWLAHNQALPPLGLEEQKPERRDPA